MKMDHERCSELLLPYLRGVLDEDATAAVEGHLATCEECQAERQGLSALVAEPAEPLTDLERASLHRDLRSRISLPADPGAPDKDRLAWLPPALGVAALLLAVVVGMQLGGGGGGDTAGESLEEIAPDGPRPATLTLGKAGVTGTRSQETTFESGEGAADSAGSESVTSDASAPEEGPEMERQGGDSLAARRDVEDRLKAFARAGPTFVRFARSYTVADVDELTTPFIDDLASDAPPGTAAQVTECAELVVSSREFATLPAAAAHGKFRGDRSLLLGFVWTPEDEGPLDNYVLYVWPSGSCDAPTHSQSGRIRTRR